MDHIVDTHFMVVSINVGSHTKWMVYNGISPISIDDFVGIPLFQETSDLHHIIYYYLLIHYPNRPPKVGNKDFTEAIIPIFAHNESINVTVPGRQERGDGVFTDQVLELVAFRRERARQQEAKKKPVILGTLTAAVLGECSGEISRSTAFLLGSPCSLGHHLLRTSSSRCNESQVTRLSRKTSPKIDLEVS